MSDYIPTSEIRRIFSELGSSHFNLTLRFFNHLINIADNVEPILEILDKHHISLRSIHQKLLYIRYANAIFAEAYFCLKMIIQSRKKFNSVVSAFCAYSSKLPPI